MPGEGPRYPAWDPSKVVELFLAPHPAMPPVAVQFVNVQVRPLINGLQLLYVVEGDPALLQLPPPQEPGRAEDLWQTTCFELFLQVPGEQAYTMDSIEADGRKGHTEWSAKYDGHDQPTAGAPGVTVSLQKLDRNTELVTNKRDGKVTSTYTRVLVDDGKTIMSIGRNANNKVIWVRVFEKQ